MNFKVGDVCRTRDGREVEILKVDAPGELPIVGMFLNEHNLGTVRNWHADGHYLINKLYKLETDLLPPKRTRNITVWVNVYSDEEVIHDSEVEAKQEALKHALAVAVPHKFVLEY